MSKNFLDLLPEDEREKALSRAQKRLERKRARRGLDIAPEIYLAAEFGYYFGWDALMAIRRGYTVVPGTNEKEVFTLEEAYLLLEGAKKVWASKLIDQANVSVISNGFTSEEKDFSKAMSTFTDRAEVTE